jgi:hypothetical protein
LRGREGFPLSGCCFRFWKGSLGRPPFRACPQANLDRRAAVLDRDEIVRVRVASTEPRRSSGASLGYEQPLTSCLYRSVNPFRLGLARRGRLRETRVTAVQVASEGKPHPMPLKGRECEVGAAHDAALWVPRRRQERMMPNHDAEQVIGKGVKQLLCSGNLTARDPSF